jgi:hypothetical protein
MSAEQHGELTEPLIRCNQCGNEVPRLEYCIRCGDPLSDEYSVESRRERRSRFAAAPDESARTVALISTLFPQLPRVEMRAFRFALICGVAIVVGLALLGFFPVALVASAVLVPLLMVLYLWIVDIYEDEPLTIIGATMAWGALTGVLFGLALQALSSGSSFGAQGLGSTLIAGIVVPLVGGALMLAGPLLLLPMRRFNDVLDGATFGASSAVAFSGAHVIVQSIGVLGSGLRPVGDTLPWAVQVVSLGVLQPVIAGGVIGAVTAAFWLRYRAPVTDRSKLGAVGVPAAALAVGVAILVAAGLAKSTLPLIPATAVLAVLASLALLWLRRALHLGLLQESREIEITRSVGCPNCGRPTPEHTFCGNCGISLRALPKERRRAVAPPTVPDPRART